MARRWLREPQRPRSLVLAASPLLHRPLPLPARRQISPLDDHDVLFSPPLHAACTSRRRDAVHVRAETDNKPRDDRDYDVHSLYQSFPASNGSIDSRFVFYSYFGRFQPDFDELDANSTPSFAPCAAT